MERKMKPARVSVVGGTGALGSGLGFRLARAGYAVSIGSRDATRAAETAQRLAVATGSDGVSGTDNRSSAAAADIIFVTVPFASQRRTLQDIAEVVVGKIVIDTTVPLVPPKVARVQLPSEGSAAAIAAEVLGGDVRLVTAFHNISAHKLAKETDPGCDVLVFGDEIEARDEVVALIAGLGIRALHGGPLANAVAAEAMTSLLIAINKRYKVSDGAGISITGISSAALIS